MTRSDIGQPADCVDPEPAATLDVALASARQPLGNRRRDQGTFHARPGQDLMPQNPSAIDYRPASAP